jgi:Effector-associated domain 2
MAGPAAAAAGPARSRPVPSSAVFVVEETAVQYQPLQYTIVATDVAGSGALDDRHQLRMRDDLLSMVGEALDRQSMDRTAVDVNDRGDGLRLIVHARVSPRLLLDPFIPNLASVLREQRGVSGGVRLRLRVSVHMGLLHHDGIGWAGEPLVHCARLLDAEPVRQVLARADRADLVLVISQKLYDEVVHHRYGLDISTYRQVAISVKETTTTAWVHVPGYPTPPVPGAVGVTAATRANGHPVPDLTRLMGVVEAVLDIPEFAMPQTREVIISLLPTRIATAIQRHPQSRVEAVSVVRTCMRYPGGLESLIEAVRSITTSSPEVRRLEDAVARLV